LRAESQRKKKSHKSTKGRKQHNSAYDEIGDGEYVSEENEVES
jgi:hypothetical protein